MRNKRQFTRVDASVKVETKIGDAILAKGVTRNISANGVFIETENTLPEGSEIKVALYLADDTPGNSIDITGSVIRSQRDGMAIQFKKLQVDNLEQLKRIIMMNTAEAHWVEREFSQLNPV